MRDLNLGVMDHLDGRRLEVVADGLPLFGGVQLAVDTTLVARRRHAPQRSESACCIVRSTRQERAHIPRTRERGRRARVVVLAGEVEGRWSSETQDFLCALAKGKARSAPHVLRSKRHSAWLRKMAQNSGLHCCKSIRCVIARLGSRWGAPTTQQVLCDSCYDR